MTSSAAILRSHLAIAPFLASTALGLLSGCASSGTGHTEFHGWITLPSDVQSSGITQARQMPAFQREMPLGRAEGIRRGVEDVMATAAMDPRAPLLVAPAILVEGVVGGLSTPNRHAIKAGSQALAAALSDFALANRVSDGLTAALTREGVGSVVTLPPGTPSEPPEPQAAPPQPHPLATTGPDAVVCWRVSLLGFRVSPRRSNQGMLQYNEYNPPLHLELAVEFGAIRTRDHSNLGGIAIVHRSAPRSYTAWTVDNGRLLRAELAAAWQQVDYALATRFTRTAPAFPR